MAQTHMQALAAISSDNARLFEQLVTQIGDVNAVIGETTLLHAAIEKGNLSIVQTLLNANASVNTSNKNGLSPLQSSIEANNLEIFNTLIEYSPDLEHRDVSGATPLHYAVQIGNYDMVSKLINQGVGLSPLAKFDSTPLHIAARGNSPTIIQLLISNGAQIELITTQSYTPLHIASMKGNAEVVKALVDARANIESRTNKRYTALHLAALQGHQAVIEYLLSMGADPTVIDGEANRPSALARSKNFDKVAEILEEAERTPKAGERRAVNGISVYPYTKEIFGDKAKPTDLFFYPNEIIKIDDITQKDTWWEGELNGKKGAFPSNYVLTTILCKVVVTHSYYASRADEMNIRKGDEIDVYEKKPNHWWRGICGDKCGLFPSTHVTDIKFKKPKSPSPASIPSPIVSPYSSSNNNNIPITPISNIPSPIAALPKVNSFGVPPNIKNTNSGGAIPVFPPSVDGAGIPKPSAISGLQKPGQVKAKPPPPIVNPTMGAAIPLPVFTPPPPKVAVPPPIVQPEPVVPTLPKARVLYNYEPQHPGDLELIVGNTIEVTKAEGGWWEGMYEGQKGIFPANYVQLLP